MIESIIDRITRASIRFQWVTIVTTILVIVAGIFALTQFNQELLPAIDFPQAVILAFDPGADKEVVLEDVTKPIENAVRDIDGVINLESSTTSGAAFITVVSEFGIDQNELRDEIRVALAEIDYPEEMEIPELLTFGFSDIPIAAVSVSSSELTLDELKELVEAEILPEIENIDRVGNVQVGGGQELPDESELVSEPVEPVEAPALPEPAPEASAETVEPVVDTTEEPGPATEEADAATGETAQPEMPQVTPVELPASWIAAASQFGLTVATTADIDSIFLGAIAQNAPEMLVELEPAMWRAIDPAAVATVLPAVQETLDPVLIAQLNAIHGAATGSPPEPVALPEPWIEAATGFGLVMETTADINPQLLGLAAAASPEMVEGFDEEILLALSPEVLAVLPPDYVAELDEGLRQTIEVIVVRYAQTLVGVEVEEVDPARLPEALIQGAGAMGVELEYAYDIEPDFMRQMNALGPVALQILEMLTPDNLRVLPPESIALLPMEFVDSKDEALRAELDELATEFGGAGQLAQAEAEAQVDTSVELPEDAPELPEVWRTDETGNLSEFQTTADLINNAFNMTAAGFLNMLVDRNIPSAPFLIPALPPDSLAWLSEYEPGFFSELDPGVLRMLAPESISTLPEELMTSLDDELRAELEGLAAGTIKLFIPEASIIRVNGNPSLSLLIYKESEANTVNVSHDVFDKFDELEDQHSGLDFAIAFEQSSFIEESISGVAREGGLGAIFAVIVILIFLSGRHSSGKLVWSWRSTWVTGVSIPLSVLMAFALLKWLPLGVRPALDGLVSITEGVPVIGAVSLILSRLFPTDFSLNIMTLSGMTVAIGRVVDDSIVVLENVYRHIQRGTDRKQAVIVGTRDVAIAILASTVTTIVVFLPIGLTGGIIGEFFLPFGVAVSYALASSFVVAITIVPLLAYLFIRKEHLPPEGETGLQRKYTPLLTWALDHRLLTIIVSGLFFFGSLFLMSQLPRTFLPDMGEPQVTVNVNLPKGTEMAETDEMVMAFEERLGEIEDLGTVLTEIGSSGDLAAQIMGASVDPTSASIQINVEDADSINALTGKVRELAVEMFGQEQVIVSSGTMSSGAFGGFAIIISGDPEQLAALDQQVLDTLAQVDGLANPTSNLAGGEMILRVDGQSAVRYSAELETEDSLGLTQAAKSQIESIVPPEVTVGEGFETKMQTEGFAQAIKAIFISIIAVYVVMVITFRSFVHPFTILFSLPLAVIGAAIALWISNNVVGISALVGIMMLVGIVVTNAIVLINRVQANRFKRGMTVREALVEGGRTRLRPILMTAIAAMMALVPLSAGLSEGAIVAEELGTVVIGGLFTSTLLTLLVVPVMYSVLDKLARNKKE